MAFIMILFMWKMYKNKKLNKVILAASVCLFGASLWLVRSQQTVDDTSWMKAMIPHHSIAILTSERAQITDPRVRELADGIIETQREEIQQMNQLIEFLEVQEDEEERSSKPQKSADFTDQAVMDSTILNKNGMD